MSIRMVATCLAMSGLIISARGADSPGGVEARLVVTVADHMNHSPRTLKLEDMRETPSMRIANITRSGGPAEVYVLIDNAANYDFGSKLAELRGFVNAQPASTAIAARRSARAAATLRRVGPSVLHRPVICITARWIGRV